MKLSYVVYFISMFDCMADIQLICGFNSCLKSIVVKCSDLEDSDFMKVYRNYDVKSFGFIYDNIPKYIIRI